MVMDLRVLLALISNWAVLSALVRFVSVVEMVMVCVPASPLLGEKVTQWALQVAVHLSVVVIVTWLVLFTTEYNSTDVVVSKTALLSPSSLLHPVSNNNAIIHKLIIFLIVLCKDSYSFPNNQQNVQKHSG